MLSYDITFIFLEYLWFINIDIFIGAIKNYTLKRLKSPTIVCLVIGLAYILLSA
jgi:hypothetical protein